jgi:hypothetical protein
MLIRALLAIVSVGLFASSGWVRAVPPTQTPTELVPVGVPRDPAAVGYLNLHKRHPDAEEGVVEFNTRYTPTAALQRLSQIRGFLASFARLTEHLMGRTTPDDLAAVGITGSEMQTIGFHNIPLIVEGTILKQDYQLKQVEYALAQLKHARKEISTRELDRSRRAYADATKKFQDFWDKKLPTD